MSENLVETLAVPPGHPSPWSPRIPLFRYIMLDVTRHTLWLQSDRRVPKKKNDSATSYG